MVSNAKMNMLGCPRQSLEAYFTDRGEASFRAHQIMKWIHHHGVHDFSEMSDLSKQLRQQLNAEAMIKAPEVVMEKISTDGTYKWLLRLEDGNCIETVYIPEDSRNTLCVSSQVGCALDCTFCSTARQGFNRNLSSAEIISQLWIAQRRLQAGTGNARTISNVVLMGMGEPLLNYDAVVDAVRIMTDDFGYGLGKRRVTLSTSGVIPAMDRMREHLDVSLAVSLHAPNNLLRDKLVPLNRKYPIEELLHACRRFIEGKKHNQRITFEYVMLKDVNDSSSHAKELVKLLRDVPSKINLIPFNPFPDTSFQRSDPETINRFRDILVQAGFTTITRRTRGEDIDAACGQLAGKIQDRSRRALRFARLEQNLAL